MFYWLVLLTGLVLTALLTPVAARVGHRLGLVDRPGGRRQHTGVIPRTGGLALWGGLVITLLLLAVLPSWLPEGWRSGWFPERNDPNEPVRLAALFIGATYCTVMGLLDDRFEFASGPQYLIQAGAAAIAILGMIFIKHVNNPFTGALVNGDDGLPWIAVWLVTVFWFMGMMNTINWLDGANGLVAGVTAILAGVLALHMIFVAEPAQLSVAILPVALAGTASGFLIFNLPGKIFMGSSGSYLLGFVVAALGIIGGARLATVMMVVGLPALDVAFLIISRLRRGLSPGAGGRDHLHFRLQDLGIGDRALVYGYWAFCAAFGAITLLLDSTAAKVVALAVLVAIGLGVLIGVARRGTKSQ